MNSDLRDYLKEISQWGQCLSVHANHIDLPVWFCTNRSPDHAEYGSQRNQRVEYGSLAMRIPLSFPFGQTPSSSLLVRMFRRDQVRRVEQISVKCLSGHEFSEEIKRHTQETFRLGIEAHALIYIHGYNVSFRDAAVRAAQLAYDLKVPGPTVFFSWPSRGNVAAYHADEATLEASEGAITDFLADLTTNCGAEKVHVIAHSMGNRGLLRALQRIAANAETRERVKFGQVFLAAPDVDRDLFLDLARLYPGCAERTTLYASDGDLPVHLSAKLHDAPRAGYYKPYTVAPGVDTVAVPDFDLDLLGHSYFAQGEALLHDMYDLMHHNEAPERRQRIAPSVDEGTAFWKLRR